MFCSAAKEFSTIVLKQFELFYLIFFKKIIRQSYNFVICNFVQGKGSENKGELSVQKCPPLFLASLKYTSFKVGMQMCHT